MPRRLKILLIVAPLIYIIIAAAAIRATPYNSPAILLSIAGALASALLYANTIVRVRQGKAIREARDRATLLLDATPLVATLWNRNLDVFYCNEATLKLFGLDSKEEFYRRFNNLSPEYQPGGLSSKDHLKQYIAQAFNDEKVIFDWQHQTADGEQFPAEIELVRVVYENDYAVAGFLRDLREHKKMMSEVEQRDNLLRTGNRTAEILLSNEQVPDIADPIIKSMEIIGVAIDVDRVQIWRNETIGGAEYFVRTYEWLSAVGCGKRRLQDGLKFAYADMPEWERKFKGGGFINSPLSQMSPEDRRFLEPYDMKSIMIVPLFLHDEFWGLFCIDDCRHERAFSADEIDIMRSIGLMMANAVIRNEMMQDIRDSAVKLEAALLAAQNASSAKSSFLAKMSHEMRTPLNAVIGLSRLNLENDGLDAGVHSDLEKIYNAGATLLGTVNDVLDISKIEAGKMELVEVEYDVPSLINDTVTQNSMRIGDKPIEFYLDIRSGMYSRLYGDELRIKQLMNNLLSNAIKYTEKGTVELHMSCVRDGRDVWLTIKVSDTGRGIQADDMHKLFVNYTQFDLEYNRKIEGTGLGLPIVKSIAEMMDGSVSVESEYKAGSVFTVRIKQGFVNDSTITREVVESLKSSRYTSGKLDLNARLNRAHLPYARVLLVDDNMTNLEVAKGLMKPYGMRIDCVDSGQKSIDAMMDENVKYSAVFMDHMMPLMDGLEATRKIRAIGTDYARNIPIIALTANAIRGSEEMFISLGFQAFLSKPIDISRLDEVIRRWVRDKELEKALGGGEAAVVAGAETTTEAAGSERRGEAENRGEEERRGGTERRGGAERKGGTERRGGAERRGGTERRSGIDRRKSALALAGLDIEKGLERFGGDEGTYYDILASYAKNTRPLLESIGSVNESGLADYATVVHGIKGSSRGICADTIGSSAESLERAAKKGDIVYVREHGAKFLEDAWKLVASLDDMLGEVHLQSPKPMLGEPDDELLQRLLDACERYDMDGAESAMAQITAFDYESDGELVEWLNENIKLTNFKQIVQKLSARMPQDKATVRAPK
ncbi:MAG: ATP-binding protein [Oscillospiraceae bacterium]|nr:ATP-binding protein [Oscillospiraceae bacterium]